MKRRIKFYFNSRAFPVRITLVPKSITILWGLFKLLYDGKPLFIKITALWEWIYFRFMFYENHIGYEIIFRLLNLFEVEFNHLRETNSGIIKIQFLDSGIEINLTYEEV